MAAKQSAYLADILSDPTEELGASPRSPERNRPSPLLSRESALSRVASGEVRQVTQLLLDPGRVKVWQGNARLYANLSEENCRDLIDSMLAENGQKVPAVVRRVEGDPTYDYEVIAGTRRHFAISWLRRNSYPDMQFLAQVVTLDDEAAFRLADLENRARKDISDMERARNYAVALTLHYGGHATRMAERLNVSKSWLSKTLKAATLPDTVLDAFASLSDIALKPAYALATLLDDKAVAKLIVAKAREIAREQQALRASGNSLLDAAQVMRRLMQAPQEVGLSKPDILFSLPGKLGRTAISVQSIGRQGINIRVHSASGADIEELVESFRKTLEHLEASGQGLLR